MVKHVPSLETFFSTFNIMNFAVDDQEQQLVFSTNISGRYDLWAMDLDHGYPYPLSDQGQMAAFVDYWPGKDRWLTGFDRDGDENWQIQGLPKQGGALDWLLKNSEEKFFFGDVTEDGKKIMYTTSEGNPLYHNLEILDTSSDERTVIIRGEGGPVSAVAFSPSGKRFSYTTGVGNTKVLGFVHTDGADILLAPDSDTSQRVLDAQFWDEDTLYVLTSYGREIAALVRFDIPTQEFTTLAALEEKSFTDMAFDRTNSRIYLKATGGVEDGLHVYHLQTEELTSMALPASVITGLHVSKRGNVYLLGRSDVSPANIYRWRAETGWQPLTKHGILGIAPEELSAAEVLRYSSFDDREIEALFFPASQDSANGCTVLIPHGGPQAADRKFFRPLVQYLCLRGFNVFSPNYRGSSGYGESFMNMVNKDWGGGPRLDILAGMDYLDQQGRTERDKWFCVGGSYGGYMTLLLHGRHPDRFRAFVDQFGPSNLFTTLETAPDHWKSQDAELIGDAVKDKDKLIEDSPMTYLENMTKPMLVVQGVNDPRVVQKESDDIVAALKGRGQDVEYILLPDEGHGYSKTSNMIKVYKAVVEFLERYI